MKRTLVISDIHGEAELFQDLLEKVNYDKDEDTLILLGDYIDRGPASNKVIEQVIKLKNEGAITLIGNHEAMLLDYLKGDDYDVERYLKNGGLETLLSYDSNVTPPTPPDTKEFNRHIDFIKQLDLFYETENYIFVHAGVVPRQPLETSSEKDLLWIRDKFFKEYRGKKTVIFGHTPTQLLHGDKNNAPYFGKNNIIGIDGGAVFGGQLNCLILPEQSFQYVKNFKLL